MRSLAVAFSLTFIGFLPTSASADTAACERMYKSSPKVVSSFERTGDRNFEQDHPGYGYSVSYRGPDGGITVFYYDRGADRVSDALVRDNFNGAIGDIRRVAEEDGFGLGKFRKSAVDLENSAMQMQALAKDSRDRMQFLAMGAKNDCMVKLRLTTTFTADQTKKVFSGFMSELKVTYIHH